MNRLYLFAFFICSLTGLRAQDTLSFGGIYELPGAEVRVAYVPVIPLAQSFTIEEVYRLPGTFYDPARLVALLPGVVQTNDQANHLSVRGNTPNANLWRLNGLAIVNPNHTANAGTFYDFPTLSGGGVNAISAQMLDNSGFLAGGLPVEYGFATGGTFDLRLRPGSKTRRKYQAQAGFIGFDLMAEGPIGTSEQTSYLVNGRYSFTGLLADMGVDFGGEEIRFADLNAHLHHRWNGGEVSAFAILGGSSNVFRFTEEEVTEQKELTDIDFESAMQIIGVTMNSSIGTGRLKAGVGYSNTTSARDQALTGEPLFLEQDLRVARVSGNLSYNLPVWSGDLSIGAEVLVQQAENESLVGTDSPIRLFTNVGTDAVSPFIGYHWATDNIDLNFGIRGSQYFGGIDDFNLEPRLTLEVDLGKGRAFLTANNISQPSLATLLIGIDLVDEFVPSSNQYELGYGLRVGKVNTQVKAFFQYTDKDYAIFEESFLRSANNLLEVNPFQGMIGTASTRRYGLELEAGGGRRTEGWYYRGNVSLLRAETLQLDGNWTKDRFSVDYIAKLTLGREWAGQDRKQRDRAYGLNLALIANGGERSGTIIAPPDNASVFRRFFQAQDFSGGYINQIQGYFRPDLRLYKTKTRPKTTTTLALDVQNVANVENLGNVYYDAFLERPNERLQLGLIPVLSYRVVWR